MTSGFRESKFLYVWPKLKMFEKLEPRAMKREVIFISFICTVRCPRWWASCLAWNWVVCKRYLIPFSEQPHEGKGARPLFRWGYLGLENNDFLKMTWLLKVVCTFVSATHITFTVEFPSYWGRFQEISHHGGEKVGNFSANNQQVETLF